MFAYKTQREPGKLEKNTGPALGFVKDSFGPCRQPVWAAIEWTFYNFDASMSFNTKNTFVVTNISATAGSGQEHVAALANGCWQDASAKEKSKNPKGGGDLNL